MLADNWGEVQTTMCWDEIKGGNINCSSLAEVNHHLLGTQAAVSVLHHPLMFLGKVVLKQVLQNGAHRHWWQHRFSQHPTNCWFPKACHTMSPPTTFPALKLSPTHPADTWHGRHIVLETSVSRRDWIPKCHLSLSSLLFLDLSLT